MEVINRNSEVVSLPLDLLQRHPRNYRIGNIDGIRASIRENGWYGHLIVQKEQHEGKHYILAGNHRQEAGEIEGMTEFPCVMVDVTDLQALSILAVDNKASDDATNNDALLYSILKEIQESDASLTSAGYNPGEYDDLVESVLRKAAQGGIQRETVVPRLDSAEEFQKKWQVQLGDVWEIGEHRIVCGDCRHHTVMDALMRGQKGHMLWTDPPWNVDYGVDKNHPSWRVRNRPIENDKLGDDFPQFCSDIAFAAARYLLPGAMAYVVMGAQEWPTIHNALSTAKFHWSSTIIWKKDSMVLSRKDYHTQYEPMWYGWLEGAARLCPVPDRKQTDVWDIDRPKRSEDHPTMKPVELVERSIQNSSIPGKIVIDTFVGSGTTMVACHHTGRICRCTELDPFNVAVVLERMSALGHTPERVENINGPGN